MECREKDTGRKNELIVYVANHERAGSTTDITDQRF
jgi:hypothetical protein